MILVPYIHRITAPVHPEISVFIRGGFSEVFHLFGGEWSKKPSFAVADLGKRSALPMEVRVEAVYLA